jgi:lipid-binding SYLF domain-containing protein
MVLGLAGWSMNAGAAMTDKQKNDARAELRANAKKTLDQLYKSQPSARKLVEGAAGYATFSNFGMKIFVAGGGSGKGMAVNNKTKSETYMKMVEVQAGLGIGVKKFRLVWVFENESALNKFTSAGWELGGQATTAAKSGDQGQAYQGAMSVSPGIWLFQLTDTGLAAELTAKGTKYYKDDELN